ncbi:hypothetical protein T265_10126 [Opisthorchis viverrini]|uniref:Uncharacterized protein n=1 Tax=Opisthorchis viverrini TaxID=6198 RepID=A0A074ZEE9_OPIVI|nr:hypothetical protein T265_10126 [Opisthorchis viverrini]KER21590.1 hypothetical protein T265_10126 [Opisthorchis viverrini]
MHSSLSDPPLNSPPTRLYLRTNSPAPASNAQLPTSTPRIIGERNNDCTTSSRFSPRIIMMEIRDHGVGFALPDLTDKKAGSEFGGINPHLHHFEGERGLQPPTAPAQTARRSDACPFEAASKNGYHEELLDIKADIFARARPSPQEHAKKIGQLNQTIYSWLTMSTEGHPDQLHPRRDAFIRATYCEQALVDRILLNIEFVPDTRQPCKSGAKTRRFLALSGLP